MKFGTPVKPKELDDLIKNPLGRYRYAGLEIDVSYDYIRTSRQTYGFLDWLGDVGGLMDALYFFFKAILLPYTTFREKSFLMSRIFHFKGRDNAKEPTT